MHPDAANAAIAQLSAYLEVEPSDLGVRWLLNLAAMLAGRYPQDVPARYLLAPELFRSEAPMPRFVDVAREAKLGQADIAGGTIADDFDGDGLVDVFFTSVDYCAPVRLFRNRGDGTFEDRTAAAGLIGAAWRHQRRPDRLQQRRPARHLRDARRVGVADAQLAAAQRRRRHLHRRHRGGRAARAAAGDPLGGLGRLRQRRLAGRLRRARADAQPAVPQPAATARSRTSPPARAWAPPPSPRAWSPATTTATAFRTCTCRTCSATTSCYRNNGDGTFTDATARAGVARAVCQLPHLVLRLRQRRPARPVRRVSTRTRSRSSSSTT